MIGYLIIFAVLVNIFRVGCYDLLDHIWESKYGYRRSQSTLNPRFRERLRGKL